MPIMGRLTDRGCKDMLCYIDYDREKRETAGAKAPDDIAEICRRIGCRKLVLPYFPQNKGKFYKRLWLSTVGIFGWLKMMREVHENDIILFQHPMYGKRIAEKFIPVIKKRTNSKFIAVIHDLESLRGGIEGVIDNSKRTIEIGDSTLLMHFDAIICHNEKMKEYLVSQGFDKEKLFNLDIFDYLTDCEPSPIEDNEDAEICIAGNLAVGKCRYIYDIIDLERQYNENLKINLYGLRYSEEDGCPGMIYHGAFPPDELPGSLKGRFGLVWDGNTIDTCSGNTGNYLRYNNPHKTSLYLTAGIPVIVWKEAAIAEFVIRHNVGIAVDNLIGLDKVLQSISPDDYQTMRENALEISKRLKKGYYTRRALKKSYDFVRIH